MMRRARRPNTYRWRVAPSSEQATPLARRLRTGELLAQVLINRGICDEAAANAFLRPRLADMHDPELLGGTVTAAERIVAAARAGEPIALYGDYDVDGMTGLAILYRCLTMLDAKVDFYIPHRIDEGYGLNTDALDSLAATGAKLVVTVDCGIGAVECASHAARLGMDLIVTDHHAPGPELPAACAIVHPTATGDYPNPHLCGAGVALKLAWQICRTADGTSRVNNELKRFLMDATCLAALGTVADVVPLLGENRAIVAAGLKALPAIEHPGIQALIAASGLTGKSVGAYDVGFQLAPRLNAAGRMGHAQDAAELLIRAEGEDCRRIAATLTEQNTLRKKVEREIFESAAEMVCKQGMDRPESRIIVLASDSWHAGVIGIVASRLVGRFARPAVLIAMNGESGQGSARGIEGYNIAEAFAACSRHLLGHGGHAMAAGLRIQADRVQAFTEALAEHAAARIGEELLTPALNIDAEVRLGALSVPLAQAIASMAPFGQGNPPVMLAARGVKLVSPAKRMGRTGQTLGLLVAHDQAVIRCVGFGMGDLADRLAGVSIADIAGEPVINHFNGRTNVELHLADVVWE